MPNSAGATDTAASSAAIGPTTSTLRRFSLRRGSAPPSNDAMASDTTTEPSIDALATPTAAATRNQPDGTSPRSVSAWVIVIAQAISNANSDAFRTTL